MYQTFNDFCEMIKRPELKKPAHQHKYEAKRPQATVLVCACGKFRHVITAETEVVAERKPESRAEVIERIERVSGFKYLD